MSDCLHIVKQTTYSLATILVLLASSAASAVQDSYECLIVPNQTVELRSPTDGLIDKVLVRRGDQIKNNQVLVVLESSVQKSAVQIAKYRTEMDGRIASSKSRLDFADKKLKRVEELGRKNLVSDQLADEAQAEKLVAEAELLDAMEAQQLAKHDYQHALNQLYQRTLRSPFDGVVVDRMLNPGDLAESGSGPKPILKLAQIDPLLVEVTMPLEAYGKLSVGMSGTVTPEGLLGSHSAKIAIVDSVFDAASGMFGVRLQMSNNDGAVPGGIRCSVTFDGL